MFFERFYCPTVSPNSKKFATLLAFLAENELKLDEQIECFILAYNDDETLIACAGLAKNIIKCVAISEDCRGEGVALKLITEVVNLAYEQQQSELFIFTKPEYEHLFQDCGFYPISSAYPHVVLMENSATRLQKQCQQWQKQRVEGKKIGSIVMNANPFTLGHRYLIEQALKQCDHLHLFVVEENASLFSYQERFSLVEQGIKDLERITLHNSSPYIISRATFPDYFIKEQGIVNSAYLEIDLRIFRQHIAPALNITHRFVGTEPICAVTAEYNKNMHYWLQHAEMASAKIEVVELERKHINATPISASLVRKLYLKEAWNELIPLVPQSTLEFLKTKGCNSINTYEGIN